MCAYVYETLSTKSEGFGKQNLQCFFLGSTTLPKWFKELEYFHLGHSLHSPPLRESVEALLSTLRHTALQCG
jgi:hypothetical protein